METIKIQNQNFLFDSERTINNYLNETKIIDNCDCEDCKFYAEVFIKEPLEIFDIFKHLGIDLEKNSESEPTGVWCVRKDNGDLAFCEQIYRFVGKTSKNDIENYIKTEREYLIEVNFYQDEFETVAAQLTIKNLN